jgi:hypothetical protein
VKPWIVDLLKDAPSLIGEFVQRIRDRRAGRKSRRARDILDDYQWRSTAASQRAHEAARKRGELDR